jgi:hypothetical protein
MTNEEQKLREFISKYVNDDNEPTFLSDLTALISEGYVEKAKYDEAVRQRDELRERCKQLEFMIEKGLGWDDVKNDISMPHEL